MIERRYNPLYSQTAHLAAGLFQKNDGSVWYRNPAGSEVELGGGGGGSVTDRARYAEAVVGGGVADNGVVTWDPVPVFQDGRELLSFADPQAPTALIAGTYAGTVWMQGSQQVGKRLRLDFEMDNGNSDSGTFETEGPLDGIGAQNPTYSVSGTWHLGVGGVIFCAVNHDVGGSYGQYQLFLQMVSEG